MLGTFLLYNPILVFSTLFVFLYEKSKERIFSLFFLITAFLIIYIPAAVRYNIGSDYFSYVNIYEKYSMGGEIKQEIGLKYLMDFLLFFDLTAHSLFVLSSFLIYMFLFLSYPKRGASIYHFSYMVFFYLFSYNLVRTAIVLSLCLLLFRLHVDGKNKWLQLIVFMLALAFHKTAVLIFIPLFLLWVGFDRLFLKRRIFFLFFISVLLLFFFRDDFVSFIVNSGIVDLIGYGHYLKSSYFKITEINTGFGIMLKISILIIPFLFYRKIDERYRGVVIVTSTALIFSIIMQSSIEIFSRVQRFYIFGFIFSMLGLYLIEGFKYRRLLLVYAVFWSLIFFEMDINRMRSDECASSRVSPYVSIFNKQDDKSWSGITQGECNNW